MNENEHTPVAPREQQILALAIAAIERQTDLRITTVERQTRETDKVVYTDAVLRIDGEEYVAEIKTWAQHATLGAIVEMMKRYPHGMLVADYVNPKMADRLREAEVEFIDTAGNAFIKTPFHHVQIKGNRKPETIGEGAKPRKLRAFTATGLKVTYAFLCDPDLIAAPYRAIAQVAGVALGTVGKVIDDMTEAGYLVKQGNERRIVRCDAMLETWVDRYPAALRPKLLLGFFDAETPDWWKAFDVEQLDAVWGGEVAGAHYTEYLQPAVATVYVPKHAYLKLIATARLRKMARPTGDAGTVELLTPFWRMEDGRDPFVHPILAYADLIATGEARNLEVARRLYDERIARHLRQA